MNTSAVSHIQGWAPRCLIVPDVFDTPTSATVPPRADGLTPVELRWNDERLISVRLLQDSSGVPEHLLLPRLVEPHAHLDKAFTWEQAPNLEGTYSGALTANLAEHQTRTTAQVRDRAERALQQAFRHGLRAMRSHIDSLGPGADCSWEALLDAQSSWRERIALQLVALLPIEHWSTTAGKDLAQRVAASGGLLGGVLVPPCRGRSPRRALTHMLRLAEQLGCGIDLHIDEAQTRPGEGLLQLLHVLDRNPVQVPITCSHASSLALLPPRQLKRVIARMAAHNLQVVALPLTNGWLLGRQAGCSPLVRPLAPILQLQQGGVRVAVGGDNVQAPWFPGGNFDPLVLMSQSLPLAQLAPWERLGLMPFTTEAARVLELPWDGTLQRGAPADLLILKASTWSETFSQTPSRQLVVRGAFQPD